VPQHRRGTRNQASEMLYYTLAQCIVITGKNSEQFGACSAGTGAEGLAGKGTASPPPLSCSSATPAPGAVDSAP
jgi:hypothetical protein